MRPLGVIRVSPVRACESGDLDEGDCFAHSDLKIHHGLVGLAGWSRWCHGFRDNHGSGDGIAVLGTLLSSVLAQLISAHYNRQQGEQARQDRQEEREIEEKRRDFVERRTTYTHLNTESRRFRRALKQLSGAHTERWCNR